MKCDKAILFSRAFVPLFLLAMLCAAPGIGQEKPAAMIPVKYDRLKAEVLKQRGKVLIVDFWAGY
jgi:hypothetical protein